ncbi:hypothetical protein BIT28_23900 [Photobacterium proteolyticum]|uniref:Uncharacterized protein n=1 Tax=Photobacterium proteolyticum TaxID=1903952 RepID=A0A1Q9GBK1_9GAMM|nr:hypothetical protein [Photobacterium proteolyticum]OLQ71710.1 hypothetical protein BIT28_23900 [Photobacterium proteolyticum]
MNKLIIASFFILFSQIAAAGGSWHSNLHVTEVWSAHDKERVVFKIEGGKYTKPPRCSKSDYYEVSHPYDYKTALSILLTALTTQKTVKVVVVDDQCGVFDNPLVSTVVIER